jgi:hypothetical protein
VLFLYLIFAFDFSAILDAGGGHVIRKHQKHQAGGMILRIFAFCVCFFCVLTNRRSVGMIQNPLFPFFRKKIKEKEKE